MNKRNVPRSYISLEQSSTSYQNRNKHDALLEINVSFGTNKGEIEKIKYLLSYFTMKIKIKK